MAHPMNPSDSNFSHSHSQQPYQQSSHTHSTSHHHGPLVRLEPVFCTAAYKALVTTISRFTEHQRTFVRAVGFGGMLELPMIERLDRHFSAYSYSRIRALQAMVDDGHGALAPMDSSHVGIVFGIPHEGAPLPLVDQNEGPRVPLDTDLTLRQARKTVISKAGKDMDMA